MRYITATLLYISVDASTMRKFVDNLDIPCVYNNLLLAVVANSMVVPCAHNACITLGDYVVSNSFIEPIH